MAGQPFRRAVHGPVVTLVFGDAATQHAALSRLECFYESEKHANTYLSCEEAARERICKGYEAFNLPLDTVPRWMDAMRAAVEAPDHQHASPAHSTSASEDDAALPWWHAHCTPEERAVLDTLAELTPQPAYLISALVRDAEVALAHERLHALYYFSAPYRALLATLWADLSRNVQAAIAYDLRMRGYRESVWIDELGAYLGVRIAPQTRRADPCLEFGKKCADECRAARQTLVQRIPTFWREDAGVDETTLELTPAFLEAARLALAPPKKHGTRTGKGGRK